MSFGPYIKYMSRQAKQEFGLDWSDWLGSSETLSTVSTSWKDEDGNDASSLETGTPSISGSVVTTTKDANTGTAGSNYFVIFTVTTSTGRILGGDRLGTFKLKITENA